MRKSLLLPAIMALLTGPLNAALAQQALAPAKPGPCPEGTFHGQCVNPFVARAGREAAIAITQAQISLSGGHPYAASADTTYAYPNNVAAYPPIVSRQTIFGNGAGTRGAFDRGLRGE